MFYRGSCTRLVPGLVGFFAENLNVLDADADVFVGNSAVPWGSLPLVLAIPVHVLQPPVRLGFASGSFLSSPVHWALPAQLRDKMAQAAMNCCLMIRCQAPASACRSDSLRAVVGAGSSLEVNERVAHSLTPQAWLVVALP